MDQRCVIPKMDQIQYLLLINQRQEIYYFKTISSSSWTWTSLEELECAKDCRKMLPHRQNQEATGPQPPAHAQRLAWDWRGRCLARITPRYLSTCFMSSNVIKQPQLPHLSIGHLFFHPSTSSDLPRKPTSITVSSSAQWLSCCLCVEMLQVHRLHA